MKFKNLHKDLTNFSPEPIQQLGADLTKGRGGRQRPPADRLRKLRRTAPPSRARSSSLAAISNPQGRVGRAEDCGRERPPFLRRAHRSPACARSPSSISPARLLRAVVATPEQLSRPSHPPRAPPSSELPLNWPEVVCLSSQTQCGRQRPPADRLRKVRRTAPPSRARSSSRMVTFNP
jgi:hypothetical protein